MKKLLSFALFCLTLAVFSSCSKTLTEPHAPTKTDSTSVDSSKTSCDTATDPRSLLTSQTWVYYEYFNNFGDPGTTLAWKTNRSSNTLNLALNQVKFNTDSTYWEIDENGNTLKGTWTFLNNQTQVQVINSKGTFTSTIQLLTRHKYEWWATTTGTYGVMVPKGQPVDSTGDRTSLLTTHDWAYQEYFTNWSLTAPPLVWKTNKSNSTLNLSKNVSKFNTDGTYWEIDQDGIYLTGTWIFLNNQTQLQVHNSRGTWTSTIKLLTADRLEWLDVNNNTYGEEVLQ